MHQQLATRSSNSHSAEARVTGWKIFSIRSTKVQGLDGEITSTKRSQSLNSANQTNRGWKRPERGTRERRRPSKVALLRTTSNHRTARLNWGSKHSPSGVGWYAVAAVGRHPDICRPRNQRTMILHPTTRRYVARFRNYLEPKIDASPRRADAPTPGGAVRCESGGLGGRGPAPPR
jgi:hypothetical protein